MGAGKGGRGEGAGEREVHVLDSAYVGMRSCSSCACEAMLLSFVCGLSCRAIVSSLGFGTRSNGVSMEDMMMEAAEEEGGNAP